MPTMPSFRGTAATVFSALFALAIVTGVQAQPDGPFEGFRQVETDHFTFIYEPRDRAAVAELLEYADDVYEQVTDFLDNRPSGRIRVFINGRTDRANGFFDPTPRHHISLFVASPSTQVIGARTENWLRVLFIHELTHYVHFMYEQGTVSALATVFGAPLRAVPGAFMPGWAIEGIAMEAETRFTEGGRGRNPYHEIYTIAPILEGRMFDYRRAGFDSHRPPRGRFYVAGLLFTEYLLNRFGEDTFTRIHQEFLRLPIWSFDRAVESVTGYAPETLWVEMVDELTERYRARRDLDAGVRFTPDRTADYYRPVVVGDDVYTYRTAVDRRPAIVRFSTEHHSPGKATVVEQTTLIDGDSFDVREDGAILYAAVRADSTTAGPRREQSRLYLREPDGELRRVTSASGLYHPRFVGGKSDSDYAVSVQRQGQYHRLVMISLETGELTPLYEPGRSYLFTPAVSPDGHTLAFTENTAGRQRIRTIELTEDGHAARSETGKPGMPGPARAGKFDSSRGPVTSLAGEPSAGLTAEPAAEYYPVWGPDGELRFISDEGGFLAAMEIPDREPAETGFTPSSSIHRIGDDPVGVLWLASGNRGKDGGDNGNRDNGNRDNGEGLLYGSYRSDGYALFRGLTEGGIDGREPQNVRGPFGQRPSGNGSAPRPSNFSHDFRVSGSPYSSEAAVTQDPLENERRFLDLPLPGVWLPYPSLVTSAEQPVDIGIGIATFGANYGRTSTVSMFGGLHPRLGQPTGSVELSLSRGRVSATTGVDIEYRAVESGAEQRIAARLLSQVDVFSASERGRRFVTGPFAQTSFEEVARSGDGRDFSWKQARDTHDENELTEGNHDDGTAATIGRGRRMEVGAGWFGAFRGLNTRADIYETRSIRTDVRVLRDLPEVGTPRDGYRIRAQTSTAIPLGRPGASMALDSNVAFATSSAPADSPFPVPGIGGISNPGGHSGQIRVAAGLRSTLALLDRPLPFGFNLQGIAAGLFAETQAGFNADRFELADRAWLRGEVRVRGGYRIGTAEISLGITVPLSEKGAGFPGLYLRF